MQVRTLCVAVLHLCLHSGLFSVVKSAIIIQTSAYISLQTKNFFEPIAHYLVQNGAHSALCSSRYRLFLYLYFSAKLHTYQETHKKKK